MFGVSYSDGQSVQAFDLNADILSRAGYGVISGCSVTLNTGTLGSSEATVSVGSGALLVGGSHSDKSSADVAIGAADPNHPRKDLVVFDPSIPGFTAIAGTAEQADPVGTIRQESERPPLPSLSSYVNGVAGGGQGIIPLAEIWVPSGVSSISSDDVFDRRQEVSPELSGIDIADQNSIPVYADGTNSPNESLFFDSSNGTLKYKDSSGTIYNTAGSDTRTDISDSGSSVLSNTTDINFDSNVSVIDDGDGSVSVSSQDSQNDVRTLFMSDYTSAGSVADSAFDAAISDVNPGDRILFDIACELTQQHTISQTLTIDQRENVLLKCTNTSNNNPHILFSGSGLGSNTTTTEVGNVGLRIIGVNDPSIFSSGDTVLFIENTYSINVNSQIQFAEIESVDGTNSTITIESTLSKEFVSGANVYVVDLLQDPEIRNVETYGGGNRHLQFRWCENPLFDNVSVSEYLEVSLYTLDCWKPTYRDVEATKPQGLLSGEGEPIASYRCTDGMIENPFVHDCRRGIDFAWGSRNFTIRSPSLHGCVIGGITVHQDDEAGNFDIIGGEIVCQSNVPDSAHNGHGISMSSTAETTITGTKIVARVNGILASGPTDVSGVEIEPSDNTSEGRAGILIKSSNCSFDGIEINDPDGHFDEGVWIDASDGAVSNIDVHCKKCDHGNTSLVNVDGRSNPINDVRISGNYYQTTGTANQGMIVQANGTNRVENVWISANIHNVPEQGVRVETNTDGVVDNIVVHDAYLNTGQAAVFSNGSGTFETLRVRDCSADTGSTSVSFNETVNKIFITNNDLSGSIDVGSNSTTSVSGNL